MRKFFLIIVPLLLLNGCSGKEVESTDYVFDKEDHIVSEKSQQLEKKNILDDSENFDKDSDSDGLTDLEETLMFKTDYQNNDSDGDSYFDGEEIKYGYDPLGLGELNNSYPQKGEIVGGCNYPASEKDSDGLKFHIFELFTDDFDGAYLGIKVETDEIFSCHNFGLEHEVNIKGSNINIKVGDVIHEKICATALGPATFQENLGKVQNGEYVLNFEWQNKLENYKLVITTNFIYWEPVDVKLITPCRKKNIVKRVPDGLVEASCYSEYLYNDCKKFFDEIGQKASLYLKPNDNKVVRTLLFLYPENDDRFLFDIFKKYDDKDYLKIYLSTWKGKKFCCGRSYDDPVVVGGFARYIDYDESYVADIKDCLNENLNVLYQQKCVQKIIFEQKDKNLCDQLDENKNLKLSCLLSVAKLNLDEDACLEVSWSFYSEKECPACPEDCITYIAKEKNDSSICQKLNNAYCRSNCYAEYKK